MAGKPPVFKIPPAPAKTKKGSAWSQFVNYWAAHGYPSLKQNAPDIQAAAQAANIDPIWFAGLLLIESGAKYNSADAKVNGKVTGIGIGQVNPVHVGETVPWDPTKTVTEADLRSPGFNLRWSAYYAATQVGKYGYAQAYQQGYNPGYTGNKVDPQGLGPNHFVQKWNAKYVVAAGPTTPPGPAGPQVPGGTAPAAVDVKDPYVVMGKDGKVSFVNSQAGLPKNALNWFGLPMTRSQFLRNWNSYDNTYLAYTGKRATAAQVAQILQHGWSTTQIQMQLANTPAFKNSPVWKQNAPSYTAAWQSIYGPNSKPDPKALRYAIVHNLDSTAFQETLRQRTDYGNSLEFKQKTAALSGTYTQIYGVPDANGDHVIKQAAKNGYDNQMFANYLRKQPQYTSSDEFKSNAMGWADKMGLLNQAPLEANAALATASTPAPVMASPAPSAAPAAAPVQHVTPDNRPTKGP